MIKPMTLPEVLKRMSGDAKRCRAALIKEARAIYWRGADVAPWQPTGHYVSAGARIEARLWGHGFRWRLNGFAPDGSDVL